MAQTETYLLGTLVDMAADERLSRRQRRRMEIRMRDDDYRDTLFLELEQHCCNCGNPVVSGVARSSFAMQSNIDADQVQFGIDPDTLQEFLDVIADFLINKLPRILEVLLPLFLSLFALAALPSVTLAQACERPKNPDAPRWEPPPQTAAVPAALPCETASPLEEHLADVPEWPTWVLAQLDCTDGQCTAPGPRVQPDDTATYEADAVAAAHFVSFRPVAPVQTTQTFVATVADERMPWSMNEGYTATETVYYTTRSAPQPVRNVVRASFRLVRARPIRRIVQGWRANRARRVASRLAVRGY